MQRCPYLYEMKERLLQDRGAEQPLIVPTQQERELSRELMDSHRDIRDVPVGTVVKVGEHTAGLRNKRFASRDPLLLKVIHPKKKKNKNWSVI